MAKKIISMLHKELDRHQIIWESTSRHITQDQATERISISIRQVRRLVQRYRIEGPQGLVSRRRGKRPNNAFSAKFRSLVISLVRD
ncbi:winged helix-turn helix protein [Scandinavium goeteborgense]|uniref:Winged helix-turn helix protein n=1 Tax=Scandinavium goeteborgense TaxID=1851514 RepID=A0A4R6EN35_SCAGO|nr:winged helix-turn helix protein [Scandinavium goeteborgense]